MLGYIILKGFRPVVEQILLGQRAKFIEKRIECTTRTGQGGGQGFF